MHKNYMSKDEDTEFDDREVKKDEDIYASEDLSEDDGVSTEESAFMQGYKKAKEEEEDY